MSDTTLKQFSGINNRRPASDLSYVDRERRQRNFVKDALNVDLTGSGTLTRRAGYARVAELDGCRSLWADDDAGYFASGSQLFEFDGASPPTAVATLASAYTDVSYARTPLGLVWSDGYQNRLMPGAIPLTVPTPNPTPHVTAQTGGALRAGQYLTAFAAVRAGQQSPMSTPTAVLAPEGGKIVVTSAPQPHDVRVFVSPADGSTMYLESVLVAGATTVEIPLVTSSGFAVTYAPEAPMPPGAIVRLHRGRLLVAAGGVISYSNPYHFGVMDPTQNYVPMGSEVTLLESVEDGVFVATTDKTWFAAGDDFANPTAFTNVLPFGATPGTAVHDPLSNNVRWFSPKGLIEGTPAGRVSLLQDDHMVFGEAAGGASLVREQSGYRSILTSLRGSAPPGVAISSSFMDAEIFKE